MRKPVYFYYKIDKKGHPMPGSNFRSNKILHKKDLIRYTPLSVECCSGDPIVNPDGSVLANNKYYFVRLDENNIPVDMSLIMSKFNKKIEGYQQIYAISCCVSPIPADLTAYNSALEAVEEGDYTSESWAAYMNIVNANVVTENNTQAEVDEATDNILAAQEDLVLEEEE